MRGLLVPIPFPRRLARPCARSEQHRGVICLDLSSALNIPPEHGRLTLLGFLYFRDSLREMEDGVCDRLYGGLRLGYYW